MARLPLLFFPQPSEASKNKLRNSPITPPHRPSVGRQGERLEPQLTALEKSFEERRLELQASPEGIDPEQVLVLETVGRVEEFYKAVQRIPEFDWLGEHDVDQIAPDEDFFDVENPSKQLGGRVYLMMSNQRALQQMLKLWERFQQNPAMRFKEADFGFAKIKDVFLLLKDVRRWGVKDRLLESELMAIWLEDLEYFSSQVVDIEIELWFRGSIESRQAAERSVTRQVELLRGRIITSSVIVDICYHSVLVELPRGAVDELISNPNVELVKNDAVMLFRPTGQMASKRQPNTDELVVLSTTQASSLPTGSPVVAVLDGCPLLNHNVLAGRIVFDDPDDYANNYPPPARGHGTAMCSLVIRGDLSTSSNYLASPIYARPIMQTRQDQNNNWVEEVPQQVLLVDLIHRAVRRIFESEAGQGAIAPTVKVINLSIGDPYRPFDHYLSPLARLLDWLSQKYQVLFVVSAGNHSRDFDPGMSPAAFRALSPNDKAGLTLRTLFADARNRRILSPAESINAVTVGATHTDNSVSIPAARLEELFESKLGSPISAFGSGYRRAIKPDIVRPGGRARYTESHRGPQFIYSSSFHAPGIQVAAPSPIPGDLNRAVFTDGTSNAAALLSHDLGVCYGNLLKVVEENNLDADLSRYGATILKALAVHCSDWEGIGPSIRDHIKTPENANGIKRIVSRWIGYGDGEIDRVMECTSQRATAIGFGELADGNAHVFKFPLPIELGPSTDLRTLRVTLAWFSPVVPTTQRYRSAYLWFNVTGNTFASTRRDADGNSVTSGTLQHEVFWGDKASVIDEDAFVEIKVNCKRDVGPDFGQIPYALCVTLEVAPGINIPIYDRVSQRIRQATQVTTS
jgi:Subtilase family